MPIANPHFARRIFLLQQNSLQRIASLHISRIFRRRYDFLCPDDLRLLVHDVILHMDIFTDHTAAQHDTVADHSALFDDAAAANDGILDQYPQSYSRWK